MDVLIRGEGIEIGEELENLLSELRNNFEKVKVFKPPASRKTSAEVYLIGMKFKRA